MSTLPNFPVLAGEPEPIISMQWIKFGELDYRVELHVRGLTNQQQALAAIAYLEQLLCGPEISFN